MHNGEPRPEGTIQSSDSAFGLSRGVLEPAHLAPGRAEYPVVVTFETQSSYSRFWAIPFVGFICKLVLLIPHFMALYAMIGITALVNLVAWIPVLASGQYPAWAFTITAGTIRWTSRVSAFLFGLTDTYPPFTLGERDEYPVQVNIQHPTQSGRFWAIPILGFIARSILLIPHLFVVYVLWSIVYILQNILWAPVLFTGSFPEFGRQLVGGSIRWQARIFAYLYGLTDTYPPFSLGTDEDYSAGPAAAVPQPELERLRADTAATLDSCHDIIAEIESDVGLELLPPGSPTRARYHAALELRRQAADLFDSSPVSETRLRQAHDLATRALQDLRSTVGDLDEGARPRPSSP